MWIDILHSVLFVGGVSALLAFLLVLAEKTILNYGEVTIDINDGKKELPVQGGSSLLSYLSDNNIFIPSACGGRGSCAYCKVQVNEGGGEVGPVEVPYLSDEELERGVRLSCQVKVRTDMKISIPDELFSVKKFSAKVIHKKELTHDIIELKLGLIEPKEIDIIAGQYIQLSSEPYKGREGVNRAYSIASKPSQKNEIELIIRRVPEGICTTWVFDHLKEGQKVDLSGPYGDFYLSDSDSPIVFIAGGSGMAPIWSIVRHMKERGIDRKAHYFFGALTQRDLFFTEELKALEEELDWFTYMPALSDEPEGSGWSGERGLVTDVVRNNMKDLSGHEAYLCGSPGMIDACIEVLKELGIPEEKIFYDKFA